MGENDSNDGKAGGHGKPDEGGHKLTIFINDKAYEVHTPSLSGAQIKALANVPAEYQLFLEQPGDDRQVGDGDSIKLHDDMKFYTLPPATFG